jgi:hypothetical protein
MGMLYVSGTAFRAPASSPIYATKAGIQIASGSAYVSYCIISMLRPHGWFLNVFYKRTNAVQMPAWSCLCSPGLDSLEQLDVTVLSA